MTITYDERVEYEARILAAEMVATRLKRLIPTPNERGSYVGDTFYPVGGIEASHEWDGRQWNWLPSLEIAALTPSPCPGDVGAGEVETMRAEVAGYRKLTRDQQSRITKLEGALFAQPPISPSDGTWWYPEGDTSSDACCHAPTEALEGPADEMDEGESRVVVLERAIQLPDVYAALRVFTEAEKDARNDDEPWDFTLHASLDEALAALPSQQGTEP